MAEHGSQLPWPGAVQPQPVTSPEKVKGLDICVNSCANHMRGPGSGHRPPSSQPSSFYLRLSPQPRAGCCHGLPRAGDHAPTGQKMTPGSEWIPAALGTPCELKQQGSGVDTRKNLFNFKVVRLSYEGYSAAHCAGPK